MPRSAWKPWRPAHESHVHALLLPSHCAACGHLAPAPGRPAPRCARHPVPAGRGGLGAYAPGRPHPWWTMVFVAGLLLWRALLAWRGQPLPGRWLLGGLLLLALGATWVSHGTFVGRDAGVTLIVLLLALKTLELRAARRHGGVLPGLLRAAGQLLLLAVPAAGPGHGAGPAGPAHGPGQCPHDRRPAAADPGAAHGGPAGAVGHAGDGGAVPVLSAHGPAVGRAGQRPGRPQRPVGEHARGLHGLAGAGRKRGPAPAFRYARWCSSACQHPVFPGTRSVSL